MMRTPKMIAPLLCLLLVACLEERTDEGGSDNAAADGGAVIDISQDAGTAADAGGPVGPTLLALGAACVDSAECSSAHCAIPCEGYGACAPAKCAVDDDCKTPGSRVHCCSGGTCEAITGTACGDRSGKQGDLCGGAGQTACADGLSCLAPCMADSICAVACVETKDCVAQGSKLACFKTFAHGKRCVADPDLVSACTLDEDCKGSVCGIAQSYDGTKVIKVCKASAGPGGVGHACAATTDCAIGQCFGSVCTQACTKDEHCLCAGDPKCARDQICIEVTFSLGGGNTSNTQLCYPLSRCDSSADCGAKTCMPRAQSDGWMLVCDKPLSAEAKVSGAACDDNGGCKSAVCHEGKCRDVCTQDSHCNGATCKQIELAGPVPAGAKVGACL